MLTKKTYRLIRLGEARKLTKGAQDGDVPELDPNTFIKPMV